jgi:excisionase family DNA binding protein
LSLVENNVLRIAVTKLGSFDRHGEGGAAIPLGKVLSMSTGSGEVLTLQELADYLKIPRSTLYKLVREGRVPCRKVGRHWRFLKPVIDQWLTAEKPRGTKAKLA